jgi:uncharacterized protein YutE (UPF0331/DUF86 family)
MVRRDVAARKIARAAAWISDAEAILSRPPDEFVADLKSRDLATFYIFLAIQEAIDLAAHWVADGGWAPPDEAAAAFDVLSERGAIERSLADAMRAAAGLRNRIAHGYASVDHRRFHEEARAGLDALRRFFAAAAAAAGV